MGAPNRAMEVFVQEISLLLDKLAKAILAFALIP